MILKSYLPVYTKPEAKLDVGFSKPTQHFSCSMQRRVVGKPLIAVTVVSF